MEQVDETTKVEGWQLQQYEALGFCEVDAIRAVNMGIDWREAEPLVRHGCNPETAIEILAPLEME